MIPKSNYLFSCENWKIPHGIPGSNLKYYFTIFGVKTLKLPLSLSGSCHQKVKLSIFTENGRGGGPIKERICPCFLTTLISNRFLYLSIGVNGSLTLLVFKDIHFYKFFLFTICQSSVTHLGQKGGRSGGGGCNKKFC